MFGIETSTHVDFAVGINYNTNNNSVTFNTTANYSSELKNPLPVSDRSKVNLPPHREGKSADTQGLFSCTVPLRQSIPFGEVRKLTGHRHVDAEQVAPIPHCTVA